MSQRIYLVTDRDTQTQRLIRAANQAQAVRHAAQSRFDIQVASQDTLVELLDAGQKVESAAQTTEPEPETAT